MLSILDVDSSQLGVEEGFLILITAKAGLLEFSLSGRVHRGGHSFAEVDFLVYVCARVLSGPKAVLKNLRKVKTGGMLPFFRMCAGVWWSELHPPLPIRSGACQGRA